MFSLAIGQVSYYFQKGLIIFSLFCNCKTSVATRNTDRWQTYSFMVETTLYEKDRESVLTTLKCSLW